MEERLPDHENQQQEMRIKPVSPQEVAEVRLETIPNEVIQVVNALIAEDYDGGYATILQKDIVEGLIAAGYSRDEIFKRHMLDFEEIYRQSGWKVEYDKPAYNESYDANFQFKAETKH
jgi:hypothetical protein